MKLSEAIREGAKLRPQGFGTFFTDNLTCSCALGSAAEAITGFEPEKIVKNVSILGCLFNEFLILDRFSTHPITGLRSRTFQTITKINDKDRWTREQIADWVETIENEVTV